jgi:hypothetical protein
VSSGGLSSLLLVLAACTPANRVIVTEVFYDALGDDTGLEFVELFNPTPQPVALAGLRLEAGDGAGAGRWTLRWTAPAGTALPPGARYVIGGADIDPPPDQVVELSLQNGPDAVRLEWPDGAIDVVGYGALAFDEYYCGHPAADVASGLSLARVPDASATGDNAVDFRAAQPSPGRANQPRRHIAWVPGSLALDPPQPSPAEPVWLRGRAVNLGADSVAAGALAVRLALARADGEELLARAVLPHAAAPSETLAVEVGARAPEAGVHLWTATLELEGDESAAGTRDSLRARTGPGPLELTEIQFHPIHGEGEWVEVHNRSAAPVVLEGWTMSDRSGTRGVATAVTALPPDSLVVLTQDRVALNAVFPALDTSRVVVLHPWPSLNNSDDATGVADVVALHDVDGLPADRAAYSAAGIPSGVPVERDLDGRWRAALDPSGTPLAPRRPPAAIPGAFAVLRPRLRLGESAARVAWALPWREARIRIEAYDLAGDRARVLLPDTPVASRGERDLPASDLGPGLYVLVLDARPVSGPGALQATQTLRVEGRAP